MRLTCPNCEAQYEVPEDAISEEGREVECTNCDHVWLQKPLAESAEVDDPITQDDVAETPAETPAPEPPQRPLDPEVAAVLQEEAAVEIAARREETPPQTEEPQEADTTAVEAENKLEKETQAPEETAKMPESALDAEHPASVEEPQDAPAPQPASKPEIPADSAAQGSSGRGFMSPLLIFGLLFALYEFAPDITQQIPQAEPALSAYTGWVDSARTWLDTKVLNR